MSTTTSVPWPLLKPRSAVRASAVTSLALVFTEPKSGPSLLALSHVGGLLLFWRLCLEVLLAVAHVGELLLLFRLEVLLFAAGHCPRVHRAAEPIHPLWPEVARVACVMEVMLSSACGARDVEKVENWMHLEGVARVSLIRRAQTLADPDAEGPGVRSDEQTAPECGDVVGEELLHRMGILGRQAHRPLPLMVLLVELRIQ